MNETQQNYANACSPLRNARHEKFAQFIADGKFANDAYVSVFGCKRGSSTARVNSSRLLTNALVCARIDFLKSQNAQSAGLSREEKREILARIARGGEFDNDKIRAIQEDNRMTGDSADNFNLKNESITFNLGQVLGGNKH